MQHNSEEIWKDIQNFNNKYQISSYGRVKSFKDSWGNYREKILKPDINKQGYLRVNLTINRYN